MPIEETLSEPDQAALRYCLKVLKEDPRISYKELRREARNSAGIAVRRQIWTLARRELGLKLDEEATDGSTGGNPDDGSDTREARWSPREDRRPPPSAPPAQPPGTSAPSHPSAPVDHRDQQPPRRDDRFFQRPRVDSRDEGDRRRPAWAQPSRPPPPSRPADPRDIFERRPPPGPGSGSPPASDAAHPTLVTPPRNPVEFMVHYLQTVNREASFLEVKDAAEREGYTIYPATFGRAQAIVGLVEAPQHLQRPLVQRSAPAKPVAATADKPQAPAAGVAPGTAIPVAAPREGALVPPVPGLAIPGAIDPISGLMIFMTALDDLDKDRLRFRNSIGSMLNVVRHALDAAPQTPGLPQSIPPSVVLPPPKAD